MSVDIDPRRRLALAEKVLLAAEQAGATEAEVLVLADDSALTRFANSEIHQNVAETSATVNLRFVVGRRVGVVTTPMRRPSTKRRLTVALVSATFWWISLLANRVRAESSATTRTSASVAPACSAASSTFSASASRRRGSMSTLIRCPPRPGRS